MAPAYPSVARTDRGWRPTNANPTTAATATALPTVARRPQAVPGGDSLQASG